MLRRSNRNPDSIMAGMNVASMASWLANYYAAMVPAIGTIQLNAGTAFHYQLARDSTAHVHTGWLVALGFLSPTIIEQINTAYRQGIHDFIVTGHSQGGALAILTSSYLYYLREKGELPQAKTVQSVGRYALKVDFTTGCSHGIYDYELIRKIK